MTKINQASKCIFAAVLGAGLLVHISGGSAAVVNSSMRRRAVDKPAIAVAALHHLGSAGSALVPGVETIPIRMAVPSGAIVSGETFNCTVTVSDVPVNGGSVQILSSAPGAISSPSGNWPATISFAPGSSTTASFSLTANSVSGSTSVTLYYGTSDADPNNSADWTAGGVVTIATGS